MSEPVIVPRAQRAVLDDLVRLAAEIITRPAARFSQRHRVDLVAEEVFAAVKRPAEGDRIIDDEAAMLVQALAHLIAEPGGAAAPAYVKWAKIAGVTLADVHAAAARAFEDEAR